MFVLLFIKGLYLETMGNIRYKNKSLNVRNLLLGDILENN